ncbi:MAG TPA: beta-xylosidase [Opitutaceae bacterium]|nr:beta-xylosidase [Opitutaceae bacterium]
MTRAAPFLALLCAGALAAAPPPAARFPVEIRVDAAQPQGPWSPIWRFFGADEPNYATMADGRKLLGELGALRPENFHADGVYFRAHNLLTTGDGTAALKWGSTNAYTEDAEGDPNYDWTILDQIFDTYRGAGVRPYVEIGFMPQALSSHPEPYRHHWSPDDKYSAIFTGWAYPPKSYARWGELVYQWAQHCVQKYGPAEVRRWYWEVWNEANIPYWQGTETEFLKLHDYAVDAVRRALPDARVGGPDCAGSGGPWLRAFLDHCLHGTNLANGLPGTPLDFVSFHAKGAPVFVDGHVRMGIANELRTADEGFRIIASYPELRQTPVIIGECDPEGCAACAGPQLGYRNGTMYSSYTAAAFARLPDLAARDGVNLQGALTWAFEFEGQSLFAEMRSLATDGIDKPVLNVFRLFALMGGQRVAATSTGAVPLDAILQAGVRGTPDVSALASREGRRLCVLVWHYHDDDVPGPDAAVTLTVSGLPADAARAQLMHFRIDATHSNAYTAWQRLGAPAHLTPPQLAQLEAAGRLQTLGPAAPVAVHDSQVTLAVDLPRQAVSLLMLDW